MKPALRTLIVVAVVAASAQAQTASPKPPASQSSKPATATKKHCQEDAGFCFRYPATWQVLGDAYISGVIIAPTQKIEQRLWDEVTVSLILAAPEGDEPETTIDQVIEHAMGVLRERRINPQTLQRQELRVDSNPAQMIRIQYHDNDNARDWVEQLVFIDGPQGEIYSVALKCAPDHLKQLEPAFAAILQSWKLAEPAAPAEEPGAPEASPAAPPR